MSTHPWTGKERPRAPHWSTEAERTCTKCGATKPIDQFYRYPHKPYRERRCLACREAYRAEWRSRDPERTRLLARPHWQRHHRALKEQRRQANAQAGRIPRPPGWLDVIGAAYELAVHPRTVHAYLRNGSLRGVRGVERLQWWVDPDQVAALKALPKRRRGLRTRRVVDNKPGRA